MRLWSQAASQTHLGNAVVSSGVKCLILQVLFSGVADRGLHTLLWVPSMKLWQFGGWKVKESMFLVSLGWQISMELPLKIWMTFCLSCPKFAINFTKFWWEQVPMGKHRWRCQAALVLQPVTASATLICFAKLIHKLLKCKKTPSHFMSSDRQPRRSCGSHDLLTWSGCELTTQRYKALYPAVNPLGCRKYLNIF